MENVLNTAYNCNHRQIVFTIPKEFREFFYPFDRINVLFEVVNETIYSILNINYMFLSKSSILGSLHFFILLVEI